MTIISLIEKFPSVNLEIKIWVSSAFGGVLFVFRVEEEQSRDASTSIGTAQLTSLHLHTHTNYLKIIVQTEIEINSPPN